MFNFVQYLELSIPDFPCFSFKPNGSRTIAVSPSDEHGFSFSSWYQNRKQFCIKLNANCFLKAGIPKAQQFSKTIIDSYLSGDVSSCRAFITNPSLSRRQLKTILKDFEQYVDTGKQYRDRNVALSKFLKSLNLFNNCIS